MNKIDFTKPVRFKGFNDKIEVKFVLANGNAIVSCTSSSGDKVLEWYVDTQGNSRQTVTQEISTYVLENIPEDEYNEETFPNDVWILTASGKFLVDCVTNNGVRAQGEFFNWEKIARIKISTDGRKTWRLGKPSTEIAGA